MGGKKEKEYKSDFVVMLKKMNNKINEIIESDQQFRGDMKFLRNEENSHKNKAKR